MLELRIKEKIEIMRMAIHGAYNDSELNFADRYKEMLSLIENYKPSDKPDD